jgi:O-acetylserine/cysteine efflux transporter
VLLLGDRLDLRMIVGAAITLIGVLIIALRPNRVMPRALLIRERM